MYCATRVNVPPDTAVVVCAVAVDTTIRVVVSTTGETVVTTCSVLTDVDVLVYVDVVVTVGVVT